MELKQLTRLHLGNQCAEHFTFYEGVAPVLNSCGRTLKTLVLEQFTEMDPAFIGKSCPGLTHLALSCCDTYAPCMIIIAISIITWVNLIYQVILYQARHHESAKALFSGVPRRFCSISLVMRSFDFLDYFLTCGGLPLLYNNCDHTKTVP